MRNLLLKVQGNKYINHSFFRPFLYIYNDHVVYRKRRKWFFVYEVSATYNHLVQVELHKGVFFSRLEIINSGTDNIIVKGVWNKPARKAKDLIDEKIHHAHMGSAKKGGVVSEHEDDPVMQSFEKKLGRLKLLLQKGKLSEREFEKQRKRLLKELR